MKDDNKWNILQVVFLMMCANGVFSHSRAIDAEHARHAALFRLVVSIIGIVGLLWVQRERRRAAQTPQDLSSPLNPLSETAAQIPHVAVTYDSILADRGRCMVYSLFGRWQMLLLASVVPLILTLQTAVPLFRVLPQMAFFALLCIWGICFGLIVVVLWVQAAVGFRYVNGRRLCQSILREDGYFVVMPDRTLFFQWTQLKELREHNGDLFFWRGFGEGSYIPLSAFGGDRMAAHDYFEIAYNAWKGRKVQWPERTAVPAAPHDPTVWPPPPMRS